jgi:menaquinone-dependent protoporphyrinogen oxidase
MTDVKRKVLVAYATRAGSTASVAERVAAVLNQSGFSAEAVNAKQAGDVGSYDAVVVGSAIRAGKLMPEVLKFIDRNKAALESKPLAAFIVCLAMKDGDEKGRATAGPYLDPLRQRVKPLSEGLFAGAYDPAKVNFVMRTVMDKMVKAPPGDFRKWDQVEAWAASLVPLFDRGQ